MPTPLPDAERRRLVDGLLQSNVSPDQIKRELARAEGYPVSSVGEPISKQLGVGAPLTVGDQLKYGARIKATKESRDILKHGSLMGIGGLLGGLAGGARILPQIAGEIAGTFAGARFGGMEPAEAGKAALLAGGAGAATRGIVYTGTRIAGKMAGIGTETVRAGIRDPSLLRAAAPDAELQLARQLETGMEVQAGKTTPYHSKYEALLASKAADRVDASPVLDAFTRQVTGADHPILRAADRQVEGMADRLLKRVGPDGKIGIGELDAYIRENFTDPLKGAYARGSEAETVKRLMSVRRDLVNYLYSSIGPEAASAQALTQRALSLREAVENTFTLGVKAKPSGSGAEKIRAIRSNTGSAQQNRSTLAEFDKEYGTDWLGKAERLSMQREWSGDQLSEAYAIDSLLQPQRPSFVRGVARPIARLGARIAVPSGPVAAGMVGASEGIIKRKKQSNLPSP